MSPPADPCRARRQLPREDMSSRSRPGAGIWGPCPRAGPQRGACPWGAPAAGAYRPCSSPTPGDRVVDVPHWQDPPPYPPRGSGATPAFCHCGGIACAVRPASSRRRSLRPDCLPRTGGAPSPSGTTRPSIRPSWSPPRRPPSGLCSASASSTPCWRRLHPDPFRAARVHPREPREPPTEFEAFQGAVAEAERFLQVEMYFV